MYTFISEHFNKMINNARLNSAINTHNIYGKEVHVASHFHSPLK